MSLVDDAAVRNYSARATLQRNKALPATVTARFGTLASASDSLFVLGQHVAIEVEPSVWLTFRLERSRPTESGSAAWFGALVGTGAGGADVILGVQGVTAGIDVLGAQSASYSIFPVGQGIHIVTKIDKSKLPPEG